MCNFLLTMRYPANNGFVEVPVYVGNVGDVIWTADGWHHGTAVNREPPPKGATLARVVLIREDESARLQLV